MGIVGSTCEYCIGSKEELIYERKSNGKQQSMVIDCKVVIDMKKPARLIRIRLEKALDLPASDSALDGNLSDPYVSIQFGKQRRRSPVIDNNLNPTWKHEEFEFVVTDEDLAEFKMLTFRVMDFDALNCDDLLGTLEFDMTQWTGATRMQDARMQGYILTVPSCFADQQVKSTLHLSICFLTEWEAAASLTQEVFEFERWLSTNNAWSKHYLLPSFGDRTAWYCPDTKQGGEGFKDAMPPCPEGYKAAGQWAYELSHGDANGWVYATTCKGPWRKEMAKTHFVRRRLWVNHYNRIAQMEPEAERKSEAATVSDSSATQSSVDTTF
ncbi:C2 domain-containing protein [Thraustotheca clavata]|uniref:C2 domain-containing protein n=1 Tax=Thraustotheca clavata TaxID=74557 RepID=A0A1V9YSX9_9STRA|nr:C2 domain-containing protein [Thraustotheca clavata]